jgi:hypothetical protein
MKLARELVRVERRGGMFLIEAGPFVMGTAFSATEAESLAQRIARDVLLPAVEAGRELGKREG